MVQNKNHFTSALILALGLIIGAWVLGGQFKHLRPSGEITVKGVAEAVYSSKIAHWQVGIQDWSPSYAGAVEKGRQDLPILLDFLQKNGFSPADYTIGNPLIEVHYEDRYDTNNNYRRVQNGYTITQQIGVQTENLKKLQAANQEIINLRAQFDAATFQAPQYYLNNLEEIKQSMIAKATQDAHRRAEEFAKTGNAQVGAMKSASQGAFNIMANTFDSNESDSYGGQYDTATVQKRVRLVVTIKYNIEE